MSASTVPSPFPTTASTHRLPAGSLLEALTMWLSSSLVEVPGHLRGFAEYATARFGSPLLAVRDVDELDELLDELADDPAVEHLNQLVATDAQFFEALRELETGEDGELSVPEQVIAVVGAGQQELVIEAERYLGACISTLQKLARAVVDQSEDLVTVAGQGAGALDDSDAPAEVRLRMLAGIRATIAMMAIVSAIMAGKTIEPWLARSLCERWRDGLRDYLALLASIPTLHVPPHAVPLEARLDLSVLYARASEARARDVARLRRLSGSENPH